MDGDDEIEFMFDLVADDDEESSDEFNIDENMGNISDVSNADTETYDATLPAQHSYLGNDMEELNGRTIIEEGEEIVLVLLLYPHVVLIPGQKLPIQLLHPPSVSMMHTIIEKDRLFGLINHSETERSPSLDRAIGTTAEIRYYKEEEDNASGISTLSVLAEGSQRFIVKSSWRNSAGILFGKVQILEEVVIGDCLEGATLPSLDRFQIKPPNFERITCQMGFKDGNCVLTAKSTKKKYDWRSQCHFTAWPWWIYEQYDVKSLIEKLKREIAGWNSHLPLDTSPTDPVKFSYWVAANIPINDTLKLKLLSLNSAIRRLRVELEILKSYMLLKCRDCHETIAEKKDIFSMSAEGPQGTYVNPNGYVHETITVYRVVGLELNGRASTNHSWFPGYAWIIAQCKQCHTHMGWKFVATKKTLRPLDFWGLCRSSVQSGLDTSIDSLIYGNILFEPIGVILSRRRVLILELDTSKEADYKSRQYLHPAHPLFKWVGWWRRNLAGFLYAMEWVVEIFN